MSRDLRPPVCVVGAGNSLLVGDRIGPRVIERLEGRYGEEVELRATGTAGLGLLDAIAGQELLLVVDASAEGGRDGAVQLWEPDLDRPLATGTGVHGLGPVEALAVVRALEPERMPRRCRFVLVDADHARDAVAEERACQAAVAAIDGEVETWRLSRGTARAE